MAPIQVSMIFLWKESVHGVNRWGIDSNKAGSPVNDPARLERLDAYLDCLTKIKMTPEFKTEGRVWLALSYMLTNKNGGQFFSSERKARAQQLFDKFEAEDWGAIDHQAAMPGRLNASTPSKRARHDSQDAGSPSPAKKARLGLEVAVDPTHTIRYPPATHLIWGTRGIMHGIAIKVNLENGRKTKVINSKYVHTKVNPLQYGDNGFQVGQWFPSQLVALFQGCHGHLQCGISGNDNGAFSIVLSGEYEGLDYDYGDKIIYSGTSINATKNYSGPPPSTTATEALEASIKNKNPVRVLRASTCLSRYAPSVGIRYDGLYRVIGSNQKPDDRGHIYECFTLHRILNQTLSLDECRNRPTATEKDDFNQIDRGFQVSAKPT